MFFLKSSLDIEGAGSAIGQSFSDSFSDSFQRELQYQRELQHQRDMLQIEREIMREQFRREMGLDLYQECRSFGTPES